MGYMKSQLVESNTARLEAIERNEQTVVGVNRFVETEPSPLTTGDDTIMTVPHEVEAEQIARLNAWRAARNGKAVAAALDALRLAAKNGSNIMPPSIACAKAGVTTGEWGLRCARSSASTAHRPASAWPRASYVGLSTRSAPRSSAVSGELGRRLKMLVGKPGLDGHSNGAEQIAVRARDAGIRGRLRRHPPHPGADRQRGARGGRPCRRPVDPVGLHLPLVREVIARMHEAGLGDVPVVVGGIIPAEDASALKRAGVARGLHAEGLRPHRIMTDLVRIVEGAADAE